MKKQWWNTVTWLSLLLPMMVCSQATDYTALPAILPAYAENLSRRYPSPSSCLSKAVPDAQGQLWISSCGAVSELNDLPFYKFDGSRFQPMSFPVQGGVAPPHNPSIRFLGRNAAGELVGWFPNQQGGSSLFFFHPALQTINYQHFTADEGKIVGGLLLEDGRLVLALYSAQGTRIVEFVDGVGQSLFFLALRGRKRYFDETRLVRQGDYYWLVSRDGRLIRYDRQRQTADTFELDGIPAFDHADFGDFPQDVFARLAVNGRGELHLSIPDLFKDVFKYNPTAHTWLPLKNRPSSWWSTGFYRDEAGNLLFLFKSPDQGWKGLLQTPDDQWYDYSAMLRVEGELLDLSATNLFSEVYLGASGGFYVKSARQPEAIQQYLPDRAIRALVEFRPGHVLVSTQPAGYYVLDLARKSIQPVAAELDPGQLSQFTGFLLDMRRWGGISWRTDHHKLLGYDARLNLVRCYNLPTDVRLFELDEHGRAYCISNGAKLWSLDIATEKLHFWQGRGIIKDWSGIAHCLFLSRRHDSLLWIGGSDGLWKFNLREETSQKIDFQHPMIDSYRVQDIYEDRSGRLWLGTFLHGVLIYDPQSGASLRIDENKGLAGNTIASITEDADGDVWVATYKGLSILTQAGEVITNLSEEDGFSNNEFNRYANLLSNGGKLLLGAVSGLNVVQPSLIKKQASPSGRLHVFLSQLSYFDPKAGQELTYNVGFGRMDHLTLAADQRYLRMKVGLSSYVHPEQNRYAYQLEGIDKDWVYLGNRQEIVLNDLPAGRYRILVKGVNYRGHWSAEPLALSLHVREYFYKTTLFYGLCALLLLVIAVGWILRLRGEKRRLEEEVQRRTQLIREDKQLIEQQARRLKRLDELKSRFFANISHEFRTPLTLIQAPAEQIAAGVNAPGVWLAERAAIITQNSRKLLSLVDELLDLTRLDADKLKPREKPVDLHALTRRSFAAFESLARIHRIDYRLHNLLPAPCHLWIDAVLLGKIIDNLLSNALKFTPPDGRVELFAGWEQDHILLTVKDNGPGIAAEEQPYIFDRFYQARRSNGQEAGLGIGLALSRELSLLMRGQLWLESEVGQGAAFHLRFPARPAPATGAVTEAAPSAPRGEAAPAESRAPDDGLPEILVVEDHSDMQDLILSILRPHYRLHVANNGKEALELLQSLQPTTFGGSIQLIISDVMMPEMDGYTFLEKLKEDPRYASLPVVMLTALAAREDRLRGLRLGVDDYLVKPFSAAELLARVQNLLRNQAQRRAFLRRQHAKEAPAPAASHWLEQLETIVLQQLEKGISPKAADIADMLALSERNLYREVKSATGLTPNKYFQEIRLQLARRLLQQGAYDTLAEVAHAVGFETPHYFRQLYEKRFGRSPLGE